MVLVTEVVMVLVTEAVVVVVVGPDAADSVWFPHLAGLCSEHLAWLPRINGRPGWASGGVYQVKHSCWP